jgi:hypothetical protein
VGALGEVLTPKIDAEKNPTAGMINSSSEARNPGSDDDRPDINRHGRRCGLLTRERQQPESWLSLGNLFRRSVRCSRHTLLDLCGAGACDRNLRRVQCIDWKAGEPLPWRRYCNATILALIGMSDVIGARVADSFIYPAQGGGAGDSGVGTVFRQAHGNFAAARIDAPLRQLRLHVATRQAYLAHQAHQAPKQIGPPLARATLIRNRVIGY